MIPHIGDAIENNAFFLYTGDNALAEGLQFYASAHVIVGSPTTTAASGTATLFAKYFGPNYAFISSDTKTLPVTSTAASLNSWTPLEVFGRVPAGATIVQVGVSYTGGADVSSIFVDELKMSPVVGNGVADITAADFTEVLACGLASSRGAGMCDIDCDSNSDIFACNGTL